MKPIRVVIDRALNEIATQWVAGNSGWMRLTQRTEWSVAGLDELEYRAWCMVNCNELGHPAGRNHRRRRDR